MSDPTPPQPPPDVPLPPPEHPSYPSYPTYQPPAYPPQQPTQHHPGAVPTFASAPYGHGTYVTTQKTNVLAIVSMIVSILGAIWVLPGIGSLAGAIMGHISLNQLKTSGEKGRGMALAGVIVGWIGLGIMALFLAFVLVVIFAGFADFTGGSGYA